MTTGNGVVTNNGNTVMSRLLQQRDIILPLAVVAVVGMMIVPLPTPLLDLLLVLNLSLALTILLISMYTHQPLSFSVFPSLLLVTTLFRLALNISSTRLILLQANAGSVIDAFGSFVVGGSFIVGIVVFLILVIIQYLVITNGAGRVAEVAARFTLDAMPGKQMSIDADLNAGLVTETEARKRREEIEREADFYGAMDGAAKFVRGDAIASIIIIIINILGGLAIGVFQGGMAVVEAAQTYTLLTVGDGLVAQIPALMISTATGIIVTRAASQSNLGEETATQVTSNPRAMGLVAVVLFALGIVPGLPFLPFFLLSGAVGAMAYFSTRRDQALDPEIVEEAEPEALTGPEAVAPLLTVDPMELEIGYGLIPLVDMAEAGNLLDRITQIRRKVALELGLILPVVRVRDNLQLGPNQYVIRLRGVEVAQGELMVHHFLAINAGLGEEPIEGIETTEPAFGLPAQWITTAQKEHAELLGYTAVDPPTVLTTHLQEVINSHASELLSRQDVQQLMDNLKQEHPAVVEELVPNNLTLGEVQKVLQNLLSERISIRDLVTILEALADHCRSTRDPDILTEHVRQALSRSISSQYRGPDGVLHAITLSPEVEQMLTNSLHQTEQGTLIALEPASAQLFLESLAGEIETMAQAGYGTLLICSSRIRLAVRRLTDRVLPNLVILAFNEIASGVEVQSEALVSLKAEVTA